MKLFPMVLFAALFSQGSVSYARALSLEQFRNAMEKHIKNLPEDLEVSFHAETLGGGKQLFSVGAEKTLVPASNAKLLSTIAALEKLGPSFKMMTRVYIDGDDLVIRGEGDPFLVSERLWLLARNVARSGIKKVNGGIKIDNSFYKEDYRGLVGWSEVGEPFAAIVSATSLNFNSLEVHVITDAKEKPRVELGPVPHQYAILKNELRYTSGVGRQVAVHPSGFKDGKEEFTVVGTVGREANPFITYGTVSKPSQYIAAVFSQMLKSEGVEVAKGFQGEISRQPGGRAIAVLESPPLLDLVRSLNTYSNNFMAESVFQVLGTIIGGKPANIDQSREVGKDFLENFSECKGVVLANGSGLSWDTQANAKCYVAVLQHTYRDFLVFADLIGSMPVGGATGTLKDRFKRNGSDFSAQKVRAKTGTLFSRKAVTSLVGFTPTRNGEPVVFAIIQNDKRADSSLISAMRDWEDRCVELLQQLEL